MSVALRGNLKDFGIGEVFQLIGQQRKTGVLEVAGDGDRIQLHFDGGSVVFAAPAGAYDQAALGEMLVRCGLLTPDTLEELERERTTTLLPLSKLVSNKQLLGVAEVEAIEDLLTQDTIFALLRREGGSFHFTAQPVVHEREPGSLLGAEQILMDGLRMADEWRSFSGHVPADTTVFRRTGPFDRLRTQTHGESSARLAAAERMFLLIDGRLPVRRVIDLSRLGTFEAVRWLVELQRAGVVAALDAEEVDRARGRALLAPPPPSRLATQVALVVPFAVAALLVAVACLAPRPAGAPLALRNPLMEAHEAFELRRVRNALDAHRAAAALEVTAGGRVEEPLADWPATLDALVSDGYLPPDALAARAARPYYYARRADGAALLAPERTIAGIAATSGAPGPTIVPDATEKADRP